VIVRRFAHLLLLLITLTIAFFVYQHGLSGTFVLDDHHNITANARVAIVDLTPKTLKQAALSNNSGPLGRPISSLSFALNHYVSGFHPLSFKLTNLILHLINGLGIFFLTTLALKIHRQRVQPALTIAHIGWVSLAVTAAWLLHPFNVTSVLYVVQRMNSLSALFSIWGLVLFIWGRSRLYNGEGGIAAILTGVLLFTPLAALSKENGVLLPLLIFIVEITLFKFRTKENRAYRFLICFYILAVGLPIAAALAYTIVRPEWFLFGYKTRDFTLYERLMTESRVLWFYIRQITLPNVAQMGLFHDDIAISRGLFQPLSTITSIAGIVALIVVAFFARNRMPLVAFGVLFFLAGHLLESTIVPLELAYEHRNYLPMYGILLPLLFYILYPLKHTNSLRVRQTVAILLIGLFAFGTYSRANQWSNPFDLARIEVENHPNSLRANAQMGNVLRSLTSPDQKSMEVYYHSARHYYENMVRIDDNDIHGLIGLILLNAYRGKTVEPAWPHALKSRLKHAPLPVGIGDDLEGIVNCQIEGKCKFTRDELVDLLEAALENPHLIPLKRAAVFSAIGYYQANAAHDYAAALTAMRQTVNTAPWVIEYRLTLASFLSALGRFPEAQNELAIIKQLDKLQLHTARIEEQEKLLLPQH
jgi:hypothetical protein